MLIQRSPRRTAARLCALTCLTLASFPAAATAQDQIGRQPIQYEVKASNERMEMVVNSSRILSIGQKIPQAQVNNPDLLELTPLSPTEIQVFAKKPGVTQINLWNETEQVHTVDVIVYGDAQELAMLLQSQFPTSSLKVIPLANSVIVSGHVDNPNQVRRIIEISEDYHPKVINNITVGGVQQVLLHVKLMEVSRTKTRALGFDFSTFGNGGNFGSTGISSLVTTGTGNTGASIGALGGVPGGPTLQFGLLNQGTDYFGFLEALRQNDLAKILAEPTLVTVSGRPAFFNVGGEFPILVPQSLGTVAIEYKKFGTQVDFVPIVLGSGNIRLEVRPRVSERLDSDVEIQGFQIPTLATREVDTGVEMMAGQTLAIAGLVQNRHVTQTKAVPWLGEMPWIGTMFRRQEDVDEEIELLILVTPELVEAMDCEEVPPCGPGTMSEQPNDKGLYFRGNTEVPRCGCDRCLNGLPCLHGTPTGAPYGGEVIEESVPHQSDEVMPMPPPSARRPRGHQRRAQLLHAQPVSTRAGSVLKQPVQNADPHRLEGPPVFSTSSRRSIRKNASEPNPSGPPTPGSADKSPVRIIGEIGYDVNN